MAEQKAEQSDSRYLSDVVYAGARKKLGDDAARFQERARNATARRAAAKKVSA